MTYPVVLAIKHNQDFAKRYKAGKIGSEEIPSILHLLEQTGIAEKTISKADDYTNKAITYLHSAAGNHQDIQVLIGPDTLALKAGNIKDVLDNQGWGSYNPFTVAGVAKW